MHRREVLKGGASALALTGLGLAPKLALAQQFTLPAGAAQPVMAALPGKAMLIRKTIRPPNYETPVSVFKQAFTPNDSFFVRYHLANIPDVDTKTWKLSIGGPSAATPVQFTLADLQAMEQVEVAAVCQCSGNRRGWSDPHVAGVEWGTGAMGNARWRGVRLKDLLAKAGMAKDLLEVAFGGADAPSVDKTPDFVKSIPAYKAMEDTTLIALQMNGEPLPKWNGAPARLVVPGWTGTYWVKNLTDVTAMSTPLNNYWMATAYRIPKSMFPVVQRFVSQETGEGINTPITEMVVNSMVTSHADGDSLTAGSATDVSGIAWDGGYGILDVQFSVDGGTTWSMATLGTDLGKYSWRQWSFKTTPAKAGPMTVMVRARNKAGETQVDTPIFNGPGYHNNAVQKLALNVR